MGNDTNELHKMRSRWFCRSEEWEGPRHQNGQVQPRQRLMGTTNTLVTSTVHKSLTTLPAIVCYEQHADHATPSDGYRLAVTSCMRELALQPKRLQYSAFAQRRACMACRSTRRCSAACILEMWFQLLINVPLSSDAYQLRCRAHIEITSLPSMSIIIRAGCM